MIISILLSLFFFIWIVVLLKDVRKEQKVFFRIIDEELNEIRGKLNAGAAGVSEPGSSANEIFRQEHEYSSSLEEVQKDIVDSPLLQDLSKESVVPPEEDNVLTSVSDDDTDEAPLFEEKNVEEPAMASVDEKETWKELPSRKRPSILESYPDIEKFIGENLINKIGIAVLVLGIGYFVKYAIDQEWINAAGRMAIGIFSGGLLIALAHRMRVNFEAFSSVLVGGGLAVLYFSIGIGFHEYALLSQTAAFFCMLLITAFAVILSLLYDRRELAVIALVGGFGTPLFVSWAASNYVVLFSYLLVLNGGMTVLSVYKKWPLVNMLSYVFTVLIFSSWFLGLSAMEEAPYSGALLFGVLFYLLFFAMNVGYNIRYKGAFSAFDMGVLLSNTLMLFLVGMTSLNGMSMQPLQGAFILLLAGFNLVFARLIYKSQSIDRHLFYLLVGIVLSLISITAPVQLSGNYITLFWAVEAVLLLWLSQKSGIQLLKKASLMVFVLMFISLLMDWVTLNNVGKDDVFRVVFNKVFITGMVAVAALYGYRMLLNKEKYEKFIESWSISVKELKLIFSIVWVMGLYLVCLIELSFQMSHRFETGFANTVMIAIYHLLFLSVFYLFVKRRKVEWQYFIVMVGYSLLAFFWMFVLNSSVIELRSQIIHQGKDFEWLFYSYFAVIPCFFYMLHQVASKVNEFQSRLQLPKGFVYWASVFTLVFTLSILLDHILVWSFSGSLVEEQNLLGQIHKFGYTILWGVISFLLMIWGMQKRQRMLRIVSLALFGFILVKLFLFDIRGMNETGKILAFVGLGVLLMVVSFLYQKLKKLLVDNDSKSDMEKSEDNL